MHGKKQSRNLLLNIISRAVTSALAIAVVFALMVALIQSAQAQTPATGGDWAEKVLHSFGNGADGAEPYAGLIFDAAGNLYGTTFGGGYGYGTVFELRHSPNAAGGGWTEQVLVRFGIDLDYGAPAAGLVFDAAGNLYGTATIGGPYWVNGGTAFELIPTAGGGWTAQVLHNFGNGADGFSPYAGLIFDAAGNLYGTTIRGGIYNYYFGGTVFELTHN